MSVLRQLSGSIPFSMSPSTALLWQAGGATCLPNRRAGLKVATRVRELQDYSAKKAVMTAADVLREAMRLARFDIRKLYREDGSPVPIHQLDDETASAVQAVDIHEECADSGAGRV